MSLFNKILDKLGLRKDKEQPATGGTAGTTGSMPSKPAAKGPAPKSTTPARPAGTASTTRSGARGTATAAERGGVTSKAPAPAPAAPKAMSEVDVMNMLEQKARGTGLNWKQSIADLLFLLDLDNSREARVELAKELGASQEVMGDSARMNTWLHKTVMRKIAENGGNIPKELMD